MVETKILVVQPILGRIENKNIGFHFSTTALIQSRSPTPSH